MKPEPLDLHSTAWKQLVGGYRRPYDPRRALEQLESGESDAAWSELWDELHHQGDVDSASYAALPHLVRIYADQRKLAGGETDWNAYALAFTIEEARRRTNNPEVPDYLREAYEASLHQLSRLGLEELATAVEPVLVSSILAIVAQSKGLHALAELAGFFSEKELQEIVTRALD